MYQKIPYWVKGKRGRGFPCRGVVLGNVGIGCYCPSYGGWVPRVKPVQWDSNSEGQLVRYRPLGRECRYEIGRWGLYTIRDELYFHTHTRLRHVCHGVELGHARPMCFTPCHFSERSGLQLPVDMAISSRKGMGVRPVDALYPKSVLDPDTSLERWGYRCTCFPLTKNVSRHLTQRFAAASLAPKS